MLTMVGKTAAERKAAERARRVQLGFKRLEAWLHPDDYDKTVSYIQKLSRRRAAISEPEMPRLPSSTGKLLKRYRRTVNQTGK